MSEVQKRKDPHRRGLALNKQPLFYPVYMLQTQHMISSLTLNVLSKFNQYFCVNLDLLNKQAKEIFLRPCN